MSLASWLACPSQGPMEADIAGGKGCGQLANGPSLRLGWEGLSRAELAGGKGHRQIGGRG